MLPLPEFLLPLLPGLSVFGHSSVQNAIRPTENCSTFRVGSESQMRYRRINGLTERSSFSRAGHLAASRLCSDKAPWSDAGIHSRGWRAQPVTPGYEMSEQTKRTRWRGSWHQKNAGTFRYRDLVPIIRFLVITGGCVRSWDGGLV